MTCFCWPSQSDIIAWVFATLYSRVPPCAYSVCVCVCVLEVLSCHGCLVCVNGWVGNDGGPTVGWMGWVGWQGVEICVQSVCHKFAFSARVAHF